MKPRLISLVGLMVMAGAVFAQRRYGMNLEALSWGGAVVGIGGILWARVEQWRAYRRSSDQATSTEA